ncbi:Butyrophilin-like protein 1 [Dissostichus eleginoides]|uniref:Butyrophilin-like protein 1 n=1 Tax=Dissostichus eleginoides TaxID=100907 RepID=A0AAD9FCX4_DISEL|nr:Butyrophilin-like protein 1 [Dissostichus eleginoides]
MEPLFISSAPDTLNISLISSLYSYLLHLVFRLPHRTRDAVRVVVTEGSAAVLPASLKPHKNIERDVFDWKKVGQGDETQHEVFLYDASPQYINGRSGQSPQFKGRVSHFPGELKHGTASILIRNSKVSDSGNYTCYFPRLQPPLMFYVELVVGASPEPYIRTLNATEDWTLLQCEVRGAFPEPLLQWKDSSRNILNAEEAQVSETGGKYNVALQTTVTKTGHYHCVVTQETINHVSAAQTFTHISGASPEPYIRTLNATEDWTLLQCEVRGAFPEPLLQWKDSSRNILNAEEAQVSETGGKYNVALQTTVTKTGHYHCVVTQETINHVSAAQTFTHVSDKVCEDSSTKVAIAVNVSLVVGVLTVIAVLAVLVYLKRMEIRHNKGSRLQENGSVPSGQQLMPGNV